MTDQVHRPPQFDREPTDPGYSDATPVLGLDAASWAARLAEVEAERDGYRDAIKRYDAVHDNLTAENARLRQERDEARRELNELTLAADEWLRERDQQAELARKTLALSLDEHIRLTVERELARLEVELMRPVVEAAEAWRPIHGSEHNPCLPGRCGQKTCELTRAVDAYRAAQNTPSSPPGSTESAEQGEVIPQWERDFLEAQAVAEPADPPGLDAAIEAAANVIAEANWWSYGTNATGPGPNERLQAENILRAAAPALRAGALRDAADEFAAMKRAHNGLPAISLDMVMILLRERADRIGGAT